MNDPKIPATVGEAARVSICSEDTIRRAFDVGDLAGVRTSTGLRLIDRDALEVFARQRAERRRKLA
jgi:excisionase family DNA binding protein